MTMPMATNGYAFETGNLARMMIHKAKLLPNIKRPSQVKGEATTLARKAKIEFVPGADKVAAFLRDI